MSIEGVIEVERYIFPRVTGTAGMRINVWILSLQSYSRCIVEVISTAKHDFQVFPAVTGVEKVMHFPKNDPLLGVPGHI